MSKELQLLDCLIFYVARRTDNGDVFPYAADNFQSLSDLCSKFGGSLERDVATGRVEIVEMYAFTKELIEQIANGAGAEAFFINQQKEGRN